MNPLIVAFWLFASSASAQNLLPTKPAYPPEPKVQVVVCDHYRAVHQPEKGRIIIFCWTPESSPDTAPEPLGPNTY